MDWLKWVIGVLVAFIVLAIILRFVNRAFRHKYGFSLYGGGMLMLIGIAALIGGIFLVKDGIKFGFALFVITAITAIITLVYDFKKCSGGAAILAFFLQILFCLPSIFIILDVLFNHGRETISASISEDAYERRRARRKNNRY